MSEVMRVSVNRPLQHGDVARIYDRHSDEVFVAVLNEREGEVRLSNPDGWSVCSPGIELGDRFQALALYELDGKPYRIERGMEVRWRDRVMRVVRVDHDGFPLVMRDADDDVNFANSIGVVNGMRKEQHLDLLGFRHVVRAIPLTEPGKYLRDDGQVVYLRECGPFFEEFSPSRPDGTYGYEFRSDGCAYVSGDTVVKRIVERLGDLPKVDPPSAKVYVKAGRTGHDCRVEVETPDGSRYTLPVIRRTIVMDYGEPTTAEMTVYVEGTEAPDDAT